MAIVEQVTCDVCGKLKNTVNHWWIGSSNAGAITIWPWGDDERTGFALAFACAEKRGCLEEWKPIAEKVKSMNIGQSFSLRLPKWKEGSELQWRQDIPALLSLLGATNNFGCAAGKDEIKFYIPAPTQGQMQRNVAVGKR